MFWIVWIVIFAVTIGMIASVVSSLRKSPLYGAAKAVGAYMEAQEEELKLMEASRQKQNAIVEELKEIDENFSYAQFADFVDMSASLAIQARSSHDEGAIAKLREYASASFLDDYVQGMVKMKRAREYAYRNIAMEEMILTALEQRNSYFVLSVEAMMRYDYASYENGSLKRLQEQKSRLILTYTKKREKIGEQQHYDAMTHCPNCGAAIDLITMQKCPYCDSHFYYKSNVWMLHEIQEFKQSTYGLR